MRGLPYAALALTLLNCGSPGGGGSGGGSGGGGGGNVPNFHGQFTVNRHKHDYIPGAETDLVEKYTLDLQATRDDGSNGWLITGTAAIQTVTLNEGGHCSYVATGSQNINGAMLNPSPDTADGYVQWNTGSADSPGVKYTATKLDNYYSVCPDRYWNNSLSSQDGSQSYCTVTNRDSKYNGGAGFDFKLVYDCSHTYDTYSDVNTADVAGAWVPN